MCAYVCLCVACVCVCLCVSVCICVFVCGVCVGVCSSIQQDVWTAQYLLLKFMLIKMHIINSVRMVWLIHVILVKYPA